MVAVTYVCFPAFGVDAFFQSSCLVNPTSTFMHCCRDNCHYAALSPMEQRRSSFANKKTCITSFYNPSLLQSSALNEEYIMAIDNYTEEEAILLHSNDDNEENSPEDPNLREISVSAKIDLPFAADLAFDAFSDLPRQPSWSQWLHSVSYIDGDGNPIGKRRNTEDIMAVINEEREKRMPKAMNKNASSSSQCVDVENLRHTKWVMGWKRIRYSWNSKVTFMERPKAIEWESTSGLKNKGTITFVETQKDDVEGGVVTRMALALKFTTPKMVSIVMRRSEKISSFMEDQILSATLKEFRDIVMVNDLGIPVQEKEGGHDKKRR
jgi:uncharacterized membrane protein